MARRPKPDPQWGPRRTGLEETLRALELGVEHEAQVAAARGLADAVDAEPGNAALWREYRAILVQLTEADDSDDDDERLKAVQVTFRTPRMRG